MDLADRVLQSGRPNFLGLRVPVNSRINIHFLRIMLKDYSDYQICDLLEFGFPLGYFSDSPPISQSRNHSGAISFPHDVDEFISKEVSLGATIGPFNFDPFSFPWHCCYSPLNTVPKRDSNKRRIIVDLSWPIGFGVNAFIDKDSYLGDPFKLCFPSVDDFCDLIRSKGHGCLMYKLDLSRAYRQFPICPGDIPLMGYSWRAHLFFDIVLAFGLRSAALCCQRVTSIFPYLMALESFDCLNYMDDFPGVDIPERAFPSYHYLKFLLGASGLVYAVDKDFPPDTSVVYVGILFDSVSMSMFVTAERLNEILLLLSQWRNFSTVNLKQVQSLIGKLQFVAKCVKPGRLFISRILTFLSDFSCPGQVLPIPESVRLDLGWWSKFLREFNGVSIIPELEWSIPDVCFATDACLVGAGGVCGSAFFHCNFPEHILAHARHINNLEILAICVGLKLFGHLLQGKKCQIFCDNMSSVLAVNSGKCKDSFMQCCLRELVFLSSLNSIQLFAIHIPGVENRLPDYLSRWDAAPGFRHKFFKATEGLGFTEIPCYPSIFEFSHSW